ncbi:NAD(P)/FAD-dependent oxidoreductase [Caenimonas koreensis]|uniref:NAD(P)-binding protein n=1 Tax=Caenimonas koreensis DSM 17982 TaxID=1121255 RepID=A0A844B728_9BURK|nr:FAD-dependent oxidoreductase [Caenimonas koreensis]MRD46351.1 NAD(P)-binding protein [Caenimonas koreensis DSM 17982]
MHSQLKIAVIGSGISGLSAAHLLRWNASVTLFEADARFGGHAHTVDLTLDGVTHGVDTGFLVYNERTYPGLIRLFAELGVTTVKSDMSFSVQVPGAMDGDDLEWSGTDLASVFSQKRNLLRPRFWAMLRDLLRFNSLATRLVRADLPDNDQPLGDFLRANRFGDELRDWYLLPMVGCIWSSPMSEVLKFPVGPLLRFCDNHGLLQIANRPQWFTVQGGSRQYVEKIIAGLPQARRSAAVREVVREPGRVLVKTDAGCESFDRVVIATHPDQALGLLADPTKQEAELLGAIRYQGNRAVLHTDASVLPSNPRAWAAWNYESAAHSPGDVCVHYLINKLQPLPWSKPVIVSLNPLRPIDPRCIVREFDYAHPILDGAAVRAQAQLQSLQGLHNTWYCGAWTGFGFHEDGLVSGQAAAKSLLLRSRMQEAAEASL